MNEELIIANEAIIIALLLVAIVAAMTLRHLRMPYTIGLVIVGYAFSSFVIPYVDLFSPLGKFFPASDVILYIFLPPLLFEAAIACNTRLLSRNIFPVLGLAIAGVVLSAGIIGYLVSWYFAIPLLYTLLFGALISSTDPVAVISIFKEIGVPKRLQTLLEGESLLNDAASIILFQLVLMLISTPLVRYQLSFLDTASIFMTDLFTSFFGGIAVGIIGGLILRSVLRRTPLHPQIHQTATLVAAYLTYLVGDELGVSGVVAVVICGFFAARAASDWIGPERREGLNGYWEYIGFIANSLIFLLVGISLATLQDLSILIRGGILGILVLAGIVLLARFVPVFGIFGVYNIFARHRVPVSYQAVCSWGGLRGAVAIALFLSIPHSLPFRDLIVGFSVTIVLFTIFVQGLTIGGVINTLGLGQTRLLARFHQLHSTLIASRAAEKSLEQPVVEGIISPEVITRQIMQHRQVSVATEQEIRDFWEEGRKDPERKSVIRLFWLEALRFEQKQYRLLYDEGLILPAVYAELQYQTAIREDLIQSGNYHPDVSGYAPGSRIRMRIGRLILRIAPESRAASYIRRESLVNRIFACVAIAVATSATIHHLETLSAAVFLDPAEIADILAVYRRLGVKARGYLESGDAAGSAALEEVSTYLAERTAGAGTITMLHHLLEEGEGDERTLTRMIDRLIQEKNNSRKDLIRACADPLQI